LALNVRDGPTRKLTASAVVAALAVAIAVTGNAAATVMRGTSVTEVSVTFSSSSRFSVSRGGVPAGPVTFVATNHGVSPHILAITGPGLKGVHTAKIPAGKSASLTVTLGKGAYLLADPLTHTYYTHWLQVTPAVNVSSSGNGSVVTPITVTTGMNCD
jgi:hypothetical protein